MCKQLVDNLLNDKYDYINRSNTKGIIWDFIGGEPFLEIQLIENVVNYIYDSMIKMNHPWLYFCVINLGSNGILYNTKDVQHFFEKYGQLVHLGISIDGSKELHDACRVDVNNQGTYDRAINAVKLYRQQSHKNCPTKMTLSPQNISFLSQAIFNLIKEDYKEIQFNCVFEDVWTEHHAKILYNELKIVADYLLQNNLYNKIFISMFDEDFFTPLPDDDTRNWCGGTGEGKMLALNYTGKLYPCIRYMENALNNKQPPLYIGTLNTGICASEEEKNNFQKIAQITRQSQSSIECLKCPIANGCGWCSAYNYESTGSVNKRVTNICIMHKARALANIYYWNKLYKKLNLPKVKVNYLPDEECLKIIDINELNNLQKLILGDE